MAESTHVDSEVRKGVLVATIKASNVSQYEADVIGEQLQREAPGAGWKIAIDLAQVKLLASAGLGMLVALGNTARAKKGKLMIAGAGPEVTQVMKMTRLDRIVPMAKDIDVAVKKLS
ncbi:MAG: STAS domain-containing protein [Phycisphaerales bacterium]